VFKPVGKDWTEETVRLAKGRVAVNTGKTRNSIRKKNASMTRASVQASGGARFLEAGTTEHVIKARRVTTMKWTKRGQPMFAKRVKHPGMRKQPFLRNSAREVLNRLPILEELIELWNKAA